MSNQKGITLVESIATLGIMSAVAVGTVYMSNQYTVDARTAGAAENMKVFSEPVRSYANKDHRATLLGQATDTLHVLITANMLSTTGYLPSGF